MKEIEKKTISFLGAMLLMIALISCSGGSKNGSHVDAREEESASLPQTDMTFSVDSTLSSLFWKGFKPGSEHFGKMPISNGEIAVNGAKIYGGYVTIAMNGIVVEDLQGDMATKLKTHLESEDFFEVATYPTARFELTNIPEEGVEWASLNELQGNLTLKGVTKNITIPLSSVENVEGVITVKSESFRINRTDWNVKYGSKSFFKGLGDKVIDDEIELSFLLVLR